ncbi:MAG: hypothetical protein AMJ76_02955 [Dehalococcoidia bacterium SM23_28_1]|nr:MAG: hypothetical protein AMJ76_02955 [Dehalococcoidia bacterium SM23_28_1]
MIYVQDLVQQGTARYPELASRLARAAELVTTGHITPAAFYNKDGNRLVRSATGRPISYIVQPGDRGTCTCPDFTGGHAPHGWCKHRLALAMLTRLQDKNGYNGDTTAPDPDVPAARSVTTNARRRWQEDKTRILLELAAKGFVDISQDVALSLGAGLI